MDTNLDTAKLSYGSRPFILQPPPLAVRMLPVFGAIFILAGLCGCALALWMAGNIDGPNCLLIGGGSYALVFLGTVTIALYHLVKAAIDNLQINAYRQISAYRGKNR